MEPTNPYIKQFPELMAGKTVLYVHGFASSGQSGTVARMREVMPQARLIAPDLPIHPEEAMNLLRDVCRSEQPSLIIGTSMGAMYTEQLYGYDRICVNPALDMAETMKAHGMMGAQTFQNPRQDGVQDFIVTKALVKEYKQQTEQRFSAVTDDERQRVYGLFGDADTTTDCYDLFHAHYPQAIRFHGEHRLNDHSFMHSVVPVIRWIDDRQARRERPIIYIGVETLADSYRHPTASMLKAVTLLTERYHLFFVAPAPSSPSSPQEASSSSSSSPAANASFYATTVSWLEAHVGVPAWGRTVFTNRRDLLYGDYLIGKNKEGDPMATFLEYGSDTFKSWDDLIEYFSRLGGQ